MLMKRRKVFDAGCMAKRRQCCKIAHCVLKVERLQVAFTNFESFGAVDFI